MRKQDLYLGYGLVAIAGLFYYMISRLPERATIYPLFVTTLLLALTLIHLFITYRSKSTEESTVFKDINYKQLLVVLGVSGIYVGLINILGYVVSTVLYMLVSLMFLKTNRFKSILLSFGTAAFIFILFKIILRVPLPQGFLI